MKVEKLKIKKIKIIDLHCDLLMYLEKDVNRSPLDMRCRCALPQMREGLVIAQVLPIFTETGASSVDSGQQQNQCFHALSLQFPADYTPLVKHKALNHEDPSIYIIRAIENASAFCYEQEPLKIGLARLTQWHREGPLAYISLTWNNPNRFGGGCHTELGLTEDGKILLRWMHENQVAVDLSHASDRLAYDILDFLDHQQLTMPVIASHSNCRAITSGPRNLPDGLIKEIVHRQGIVGLNFIKPFLGYHYPLSFFQHFNHLLTLAAEEAVCFGADFFYEEDIPIATRRTAQEYYFDELKDCTGYQPLLDKGLSMFGLSIEKAQKLAFANAEKFLLKILDN